MSGLAGVSLKPSIASKRSRSSSRGTFATCSARMYRKPRASARSRAASKRASASVVSPASFASHAATIWSTSPQLFAPQSIWNPCEGSPIQIYDARRRRSVLARVCGGVVCLLWCPCVLRLPCSHPDFWGQCIANCIAKSIADLGAPLPAFRKEPVLSGCYLLTILGEWRRDRDSNPGSARTDNGFRDRRIRPLCHLSASGVFVRRGFSAPLRGLQPVFSFF